MNALITTMNRFKRSLGLPQSINVFGMGRACPLLVFFALLILGALAVLAFS
jgi:hypothetical protein